MDLIIDELNLNYNEIYKKEELIKKLEEIRSDYHLLNPVLKKINELKHYVNIEDL